MSLAGLFDAPRATQRRQRPYNPAYVPRTPGRKVARRGQNPHPIQGLHSGLTLDIQNRLVDINDLKLPLTRVRRMMALALYRATGRNDIEIQDAAVLRMTDALMLFMVRSIVRAGVIANAANRITVRTGDMQSVMLLDESR